MAGKKEKKSEEEVPGAVEQTAPTFQMKQGEAKTTVEYKGGGTSEETEKVGAPVLYEQPTCNVGMKAGVTRNMGDYNSVRLDVSLYMPCYPDEIEEVFMFTKEWVERKMNEITEELDSD